MKLKLSRKNHKILVDEWGNEILEFKGTNLDDLREILARVNDFEKALDSIKYDGTYRGYYKRSQEI